MVEISKASSPRALSKSKLLACRQCEKRMWLEIHKPELNEVSAQTQATFAMGNTVGNVSRGLYDIKGKGVLVDIQTLGLARAIEYTEELIAERVRRQINWDFVQPD